MSVMTKQNLVTALTQRLLSDERVFLKHGGYPHKSFTIAANGPKFCPTYTYLHAPMRELDSVFSTVFLTCLSCCLLLV